MQPTLVLSILISHQLAVACNPPESTGTAWRLTPLRPRHRGHPKIQRNSGHPTERALRAPGAATGWNINDLAATVWPRPRSAVPASGGTRQHLLDCRDQASRGTARSKPGRAGLSAHWRTPECAWWKGRPLFAAGVFLRGDEIYRASRRHSVVPVDRQLPTDVRCERGHPGVPQTAWQSQVYRHDPDESEYARGGPMEYRTGQERRNGDDAENQRPARLGGPGDDTAAARRLPQTAQPAMDGARTARRGRRCATGRRRIRRRSQSSRGGAFPRITVPDSTLGSAYASTAGGTGAPTR